MPAGVSSHQYTADRSLRRFAFWLLVVVVVHVGSLTGCGNGILGDDDSRPGACSVGSASPIQPAVIPAKESAERLKVFLFRGYRNDYSLGLDRLAIELRTQNFSPELVTWPNWIEVAERIVNNGAGSSNEFEYVLVGHSYGADDAIQTARYMQIHGLKVKLLYLLDASVPLPIPDNVERCIHYYQPWLPGDLFPDVFSGNPVVAATNNLRTQITNLLFTRETIGEVIGCADHFSIDVNQFIHNRVIEELIRLAMGQ